MTLLCRTLAISMALLSTASFAQTSKITVKVGKMLNTGVKSDLETQDVKIADVTHYGGSYAKKRRSGVGSETEVMLYQDAAVTKDDITLGEVSTFSVGQYITYELNLTQAIHARVKAGYIRKIRDYSSKSGAEKFLSLINSSSGYSIGGGLGMDLNSVFGISTEYKYTIEDGKSTDVNVGLYMKL